MTGEKQTGRLEVLLILEADIVEAREFRTNVVAAAIEGQGERRAGPGDRVVELGVEGLRGPLLGGWDGGTIGADSHSRAQPLGPYQLLYERCGWIFYGASELSLHDYAIAAPGDAAVRDKNNPLVIRRSEIQIGNPADPLEIVREHMAHCVVDPTGQLLQILPTLYLNSEPHNGRR
ncbi:hypothetical protein SCAR479_09170 [Seiridium cardinale]|uniref:Uncharacterized protein n=1 Tax=Seiridium cardinale TaxID=138064 RepID=A0ABR2XK99_9PEZI